MGRRSKAFWGIILLVMITMLLGGCGKNQEVPEERSLTINSTVAAQWIKFCVHRKNGTKVYRTYLVSQKMIADYMGLDLEIVPCAWDAIFHNMEDGSFDVVISSVSYTNERADKYAMSRSYLQNGIVLLVPDKSTASDILDMNGGCIGVQLDTTADHYIRKGNKDGNDIELAQYENVSNALDAMVNGDIDGVCTDAVIANYFVVNNDGYKVVWYSDEKEPFCICGNKENVDLQLKINDALQNLEEQGKLKELSIKYFGKEMLDINN